MTDPLHSLPLTSRRATVLGSSPSQLGHYLKAERQPLLTARWGSHLPRKCSRECAAHCPCPWGMSTHWDKKGKTLLLLLQAHSGSHNHLWTDRAAISVTVPPSDPKLPLPSQATLRVYFPDGSFPHISHCVLPCHCPGVSSGQWCPLRAFACSSSSRPGLSYSILCLSARHSAKGSQVRHGNPCIHCRAPL